MDIRQSDDGSPNFDVDQDMDIDVGHVDRGLNPSTVGHSIDAGQIIYLPSNLRRASLPANRWANSGVGAEHLHQNPAS